MAIGTLLAGILDENGVRLLLGLLSLMFAFYMLLRPVAVRPISRYWALPAGTSCGFTSFLTHDGSPPLNLYLIPRRLTKETFIATSAIAFVAVNLIKLPPYLWLDEINLTSAWASLVLVPVAWIGMKSGLRLQHRVHEMLFYRFVIAAMAIVGVRLVAKALG